MIVNTLPESSAIEKIIRVHGGKLHNGHDHVGQPHEGEHHARDTIPDSPMVENTLPESSAI